MRSSDPALPSMPLPAPRGHAGHLPPSPGHPFLGHRAEVRTCWPFAIPDPAGAFWKLPAAVCSPDQFECAQVVLSGSEGSWGQDRNSLRMVFLH